MSFGSRTLALERRLLTALRLRADRRLARRALAAGRSPKPPHLLTGERGEDAAFFHLRGLGYTIVARRWRSERLRGDLDLVAWDGETLVVVEVKTRTAHDLGPAEAEVDRAKQRMLRRMAAAYLRQLPDRHRDNIAVRFDILSVYLLSNAAAEFDHFRSAFPMRAPLRYR